MPAQSFTLLCPLALFRGNGPETFLVIRRKECTDQQGEELTAQCYNGLHFDPEGRAVKAVGSQLKIEKMCIAACWFIEKTITELEEQASTLSRTFRKPARITPYSQGVYEQPSSDRIGDKNVAKKNSGQKAHTAKHHTDIKCFPISTLPEHVW